MFFPSLIDNSGDSISVLAYLYCLCNFLDQDNSLIFTRTLSSFNLNQQPIASASNIISEKLGWQIFPSQIDSKG